MIITITSPANLVSVSPIGFFKKPLTIRIIPDKSSLNATNNATFGTQFAANNEYIVIKIQVDASFTGHISQITIAWL